MSRYVTCFGLLPAGGSGPLRWRG